MTRREAVLPIIEHWHHEGTYLVRLWAALREEPAPLPLPFHRPHNEHLQPAPAR